MQFNNTLSTDLKARASFLQQFSLLASHCGSGIFNTVVDTLINLIKNGDHPTETLTCLTELSLGVANDHIRRDVLLVTLMRSFVDRGVAIISSNDKSRRIEYNDPDLLIRLKAVYSCLNAFAECELAKKSTYVDIFQEFWMILVFFGYQQELRWRDDWAPFIPIIARSSPVLIKERDKLQSPGSTFSQVVLSQSINPSLRSHLGSLLPNSSGLLRSITFAQYLWLMAIYCSEQHKLKAGFFDHLDAYLKSDVIELVGVYPLVEDLMSTLIAQWKVENTCTELNTPQVKLARILIHDLCHIQPRTHRTAMKLLRTFFLDDFFVYTDRKIWEMIATKLGTMFFVCRLELGSPELEHVPEDLTRDPTAARAAFKDLVDVCRVIYGRASTETPNYFFKFAHTKIYSHQSFGELSHGDRDVALLELLRVVFPTDRLDDKSEMYLKTDTLLYRNAEDFVHYEAQSLPLGDVAFSQVFELLSDRSCPMKVKKGIRQWLNLMDRNPNVTFRMLGVLNIKLPQMIANIKSNEESPLRSKLTATPSLDVNRQEEINNIVCLAVLIDFLSEQLQADNVRAHDVVSLYAFLISGLLDSIKYPYSLDVLIDRYPIVRFIALRVFVFAFEILERCSYDPLLFDRLMESIYRSMLRFFSCFIPYSRSE